MESNRDESRRVSIDFRDELLARDWPDGKRVAEIAGIQPSSNPDRYAAQLRSSGAMLGVWSAPQRTHRYPDFQFDSDGALRPEVLDLLKLLPGDEEDRGGWRRVFWLYSPHALLDGETPAHIFMSDPQRVLDAARREFSESNECW
ncbi:hypothetical protein PQR67_20875 [Paraburkholderia fungorum]|uniref:hypothetical protein n=1 Tax=Paraburkholderia fungorum TaxID=134537 RepID=UPI0038BD0D11